MLSMRQRPYTVMGMLFSRYSNTFPKNGAWADDQASWHASWNPPDPSKASLIPDLDPHHHTSQRRKSAGSYSMSSLLGYGCFVDERSSLITRRFAEVAKQGQTINMAHWLQCYAFQVIGHIDLRIDGLLSRWISGSEFSRGWRYEIVKTRLEGSS